MTVGWVGNIEFFGYPYDSVDRLHYRLGSSWYSIDKYDVPKLLAIMNKVRWFFEHGGDVIKGNIDSESDLAQAIRTSYNAGVQQMFVKQEKEDKERKKKHKKMLKSKEGG